MTIVTVQDAKARLGELIEHLQPGEEIVIMRDNRPVAKLTGQARAEAPRRQSGSLRGTV